MTVMTVVSLLSSSILRLLRVLLQVPLQVPAGHCSRGRHRRRSTPPPANTQAATCWYIDLRVRDEIGQRTMAHLGIRSAMEIGLVERRDLEEAMAGATLVEKRILTDAWSKGKWMCDLRLSEAGAQCLGALGMEFETDMVGIQANVLRGAIANLRPGEVSRIMGLWRSYNSRRAATLDDMAAEPAEKPPVEIAEIAISDVTIASAPKMAQSKKEKLCVFFCISVRTARATSWWCAGGLAILRATPSPCAPSAYRVVRFRGFPRGSCSTAWGDDVPPAEPDKYVRCSRRCGRSLPRAAISELERSLSNVSDE